MIRLTYSNRTEALLARLVRRVHARREVDRLAPIPIVVPNRNVERYVELGIAGQLGIAANLRFERLGSFVRTWLGEELLLGDRLRARVLSALLEVPADDVMLPVRRYLEGAGDRSEAIDLRRAQLALHLSRIFEEYTFARPELLAAWDAGSTRFAGGPHAITEAWQAALWRTVRAGATTLAEAVERAGPSPWSELHVFGLSYVARIYSRVFAALGDRADVHLYALNPCEEFWEDVETPGELRRRRKISDAEPEWMLEENPFGIGVEGETPLLRLWGRPGREHVRLLGALTDCDFEAAFEAPPASAAAADALPLFAGLSAEPLLIRLQRDILARTPKRTANDAPRDPSVQVFACPSVRREIETVAAEIWQLVRDHHDLTFDRIAVIVNGPDRDLYLPHIAAVFEEACAIPFNVADASLAQGSPLVSAALALMALPSTRFARPDVLAVITHPSIRPADVEARDWVELADRLGIFFGLDEEAHRGTYVRGDLLHWDQGIARIALGAFMGGEAFVSFDGGSYLPEEREPGDTTAAKLAFLVRSLASDVRFAQSAKLTLAEWARFFGALLRCYLVPQDEREESALRRTLAAIESLAAHDVPPVSYTIAHELAKEAVLALSSGSGQQLADGVAVSSLLPMRAIPFRAIFVLGLGEGRFPAADRRDSMDLCAARRLLGDVTPPERDRYTFLETLICARERLYLSYVARDEQTGDALAPSTVIEELLDVIEAGYLRGARQRIVRRPKLRRHEEESIAGILPEAAAELRARRLGKALREDVPDADVVRADGIRRAARSAELLEALALAPLPDRGARALDARLRLSLGALRRFLECPLQAWTRQLLGLDDDEIDGAAALADEPFEPARLEAAIALRASFTAHATLGVDAASAYRAEVALRQARGRWPIGALEEIVARDHAIVLARWSSALAALRPERAWRARFGHAESAEPSDEVHDPIVIEFDDDPRSPGSHPLSVELVGRTELLAAPPRASVLTLARRGMGARGRVTDLRYGLRAFFDHAALSAAGMITEHRAVLLSGDREDAATIRFRAIEADVARAWLKALVRDLLSRPHAYLMPCEGVLRLEDRWPADGEAIVRSIELVRDRWDGGQSRFGPVRDPLSYPVLTPGEAEEIAERRFGPWLSSIVREVP